MITLNNLKFYFPKGKRVFDDVTLSFVAGNIYGLFGKNGEGKSTLMRIMSGLLFPKSGQCRVFDEDISKRTVSCLQNVFIVPEEFELNGLKITTYEQVNSVFYPKFSKDQFYELIAEFELSKDQKISTLSFGQKKKVLIAFGIATNTKLLLMDEPTNGLDIPSKSQFRKIMASVADEQRCIVISTHQVRDLHSLINHVVILNQCNIAFDYSLSKVSNHLWFGKPTQGPQESIIYAEPSFTGKSVLIREDREESEVDLELLFNAVLNNSDAINNVLKNTYHDHAV
ncbi:ABC transporter ATP-binding protein [Aquimarina mytili]|uniref:ABC transporter ATP-binding protein n=1 Tax=Aquimarina mytili TaxID=874423 RepID=A0A936ZXZ7_9FLAO|nr:ABC transporter ATP-binding protein [Aquimarina mytili]MBL0683993.1 ABC transporter ATP-binding protein [Aquimarina mytili]